MNAIVTVVGRDRVGITASVCTLLAENNINILDISQTILHGSFTMVMTVDVGESKAPLGQLRELLPLLRPDDLLFITADHGCDPSTPSTDHSREHVPMLAYGAKVKPGVNIGTRSTYADLAATVAEYLGVKAEIAGESFLKEILK